MDSPFGEGRVTRLRKRLNSVSSEGSGRAESPAIFMPLMGALSEEGDEQGLAGSTTRSTRRSVAAAKTPRTPSRTTRRMSVDTPEQPVTPRRSTRRRVSMNEEAPQSSAKPTVIKEPELNALMEEGSDSSAQPEIDKKKKSPSKNDNIVKETVEKTETDLAPPTESSVADKSVTPNAKKTLQEVVSRKCSPRVLLKRAGNVEVHSDSEMNSTNVDVINISSELDESKMNFVRVPVKSEGNEGKEEEDGCLQQEDNGSKNLEPLSVSTSIEIHDAEVSSSVVANVTGKDIDKSAEEAAKTETQQNLTSKSVTFNDSNQGDSIKVVFPKTPINWSKARIMEDQNTSNGSNSFSKEDIVEQKNESISYLKPNSSGKIQENDDETTESMDTVFPLAHTPAKSLFKLLDTQSSTPMTDALITLEKSDDQSLGSAEKLLRSGKSYGDSPEKSPRKDSSPKLKDSSLKLKDSSPKLKDSSLKLKDSSLKLKDSSPMLKNKEKTNKIVSKSLTEHENEQANEVQDGGRKYSKSWNQGTSATRDNKIDFLSEIMKKSEEVNVEIEKKNTSQSKQKKKQLHLEFDSDDDMEGNEAEEEDEDEEEENHPRSEFVHLEAEDAGDDYESGDSMDEEELAEIAENEIVERGESLGSNDTEDEYNQDSQDHDSMDSFIVSDAEEDESKSGSKKYRRLLPMEESSDSFASAHTSEAKDAENTEAMEANANVDIEVEENEAMEVEETSAMVVEANEEEEEAQHGKNQVEIQIHREEEIELAVSDASRDSNQLDTDEEEHLAELKDAKITDSRNKSMVSASFDCFLEKHQKKRFSLYNIGDEEKAKFKPSESFIAIQNLAKSAKKKSSESLKEPQDENEENKDVENENENEENAEEEENGEKKQPETEDSDNNDDDDDVETNESDAHSDNEERVNKSMSHVKKNPNIDNEMNLSCNKSRRLSKSFTHDAGHQSKAKLASNDANNNYDLIIQRCDQILATREEEKKKQKKLMKKKATTTKKDELKQIERKNDTETESYDDSDVSDEENYMEYKKEAIKKALKASTNILLKSQNRTDKKGIEVAANSKRLPLEILKAVSNHKSTQTKDALQSKGAVGIHKIKSSAGDIIEAPASPIVSKTRKYIKTTSGEMCVEPATPPRSKLGPSASFRESPIVMTHRMGHKIKRALGIQDSPPNLRPDQNKKVASKITETLYTFPKIHYTSSGPFMEENASPSTTLRAGVTEFNIASLKHSGNRKRKAHDADDIPTTSAERALLFRNAAFNRKDIQRESAREVIQRKRRKMSKY